MHVGRFLQEPIREKARIIDFARADMRKIRTTDWEKTRETGRIILNRPSAKEYNRGGRIVSGAFPMRPLRR